ncbi:hypothetical protein [Mycobacterium sp. 155]|uniref:hypothetical protein n=1 Tax=Mycobacterium sp. 155 TaxID=1157943 RepID=UPI0012FBD111|nr:hypothetical protein [Mycobacterium sp. 155]
MRSSAGPGSWWATHRLRGPDLVTTALGGVAHTGVMESTVMAVLLAAGGPAAVDLVNWLVTGQWDRGGVEVAWPAQPVAI